MAPRDEEARQRRLRALRAREQEREQLRARFRQIIATGRIEPSPGL
jgi:hypothetical protein